MANGKKLGTPRDRVFSQVKNQNTANAIVAERNFLNRFRGITPRNTPGTKNVSTENLARNAQAATIAEVALKRQLDIEIGKSERRRLFREANAAIPSANEMMIARRDRNAP